MSSVDERTVKMQFDNDEFKRKAVETKGALTDVNNAVDTAGKSKGLLSLSSNMQRVQLTASKMSIVVGTALATITNKAVNAGINMVKSLTFDPIKQGFNEYGQLLTKQNVIMNATGASANKVKSILNQLNTYSDKTIYSFGNMTDAITKFTNAGVPLDRAVVSIKGIANAAAYAGASSEEANRAMYAFSQSMSLGFIQLQDWNQIENANMGTVKFKQTLIDAGVAAGTLTKRGNEFITSSGKAITATKGWRDGLKDQWATTEVLNTALGKYADTTTKLGQKAFKAATQVRTFGAFMDTFKESLGSGWAQVFGALGGGLKESTKTWTGLSNAVSGVTQTFFHFLTKSLQVWRQMDGMKNTVQGFKNLFSPLVAIFQAVGDAWAEVFPSKGKDNVGKQLAAVSSGFEAVTRPLQLVADLIRGSTPAIAVFFRIIRIGVDVLKGGMGTITDFVKHLTSLAEAKAPSAGGFVGFVKELAHQIASAVKQIDDLLAKGKSLGDAFGSVHFNMPKIPSIGDLFGGGSNPMDKLQTLNGTGGMIDGKSTTKIQAMAASFKDLTKNVTGLNDVSKETEKRSFFNPNYNLDSSRVHDVGGRIKDVAAEITKSGDETETVGDKMGGVLSSLKAKLGDFIKNFNGQDLMGAFNLAVLSTFMISVSRFFNTLTSSFKGFVGIGDGITDVLESAGGALKSFQTQARAQMILNIAIAIGILAAALWVLSRIPAKNLGLALATLGATMFGMTMMIQNMSKMMDKLDSKGMAIRLVALAIALGALGAAMLMIAIAQKVMGKTPWQGILKGILTMKVMLMSFEGIGKLAEKSYKNILAAAVAMGIMSSAMIVLAGALILFNFVKWESIGKAGVAIGGLALAVGALALIPYQGIAKVGVALLAASGGMLAIANALIIFAAVKWGSMLKAGVALGALTLALAALMIVGNPVSIAGMVSMGAAMIAIATAAMIMNNVEWASIAKVGVIMLGLVAAFAAFVAIAYLAAPVLIILSGFAGSLALLALAIAALGVAFAIVFPLLAAGTATFAAFATGAAVAIAVFLQTLAAEAPSMGKAFLDILKVLIDTIVAAVPMVIDGIRRLFKAIWDQFNGSDNKKQAENGGHNLVAGVAGGVDKNKKSLIDKAIDLLESFIKKLGSRAKNLASEGATLVVNILRGIGSKAGEIVDAAVDLVVKLANGLGNNLGRLVQAGFDLIVKFLHALADGIRNNAGAIGGGITDVLSAMKDVGINMVKGLIGGIDDMFGDAMGKIGDLASGMVNKAKGILKIFSPSRVFRDIGTFIVKGLTNGIQTNAASAITAVASMVGGQIAVASSYISGFIQKLDQQAIAAKAKADGLADAANRASKAADKTKTKADDKAADKLQKSADAASKLADAASKKSDAADKSRERQAEFNNADTLTKAQMRSEDAQNQLDAAKAAEARAAKNRQSALALEAQAKKKGIGEKEQKDLRKQADDLRTQAKKDAADANAKLDAARKSASESLAYQKKAGDEAAKAFQAQFTKDAADAAEAAKFDALTDAQKADYRRAQAVEMQKKANTDLAAAKKLAYTDLAAANDLAEQARSEADQARQYLDDAKGFDQSGQTGTTPTSGTVVDLTPTELASEAFNRYLDLYDSATAAAAAQTTVEFNQYNTSPESLSPSEVYRQTNNLVKFAADQLTAA